jgi:hypothetical protein
MPGHSRIPVPAPGGGWWRLVVPAGVLQDEQGGVINELAGLVVEDAPGGAAGEFGKGELVESGPFGESGGAFLAEARPGGVGGVQDAVR